MTYMDLVAFTLKYMTLPSFTFIYTKSGYDGQLYQCIALDVSLGSSQEFLNGYRSGVPFVDIGMLERGLRSEYAGFGPMAATLVGVTSVQNIPLLLKVEWPHGEEAVDGIKIVVSDYKDVWVGERMFDRMGGRMFTSCNTCNLLSVTSKNVSDLCRANALKRERFTKLTSESLRGTELYVYSLHVKIL